MKGNVVRLASDGVWHRAEAADSRAIPVVCFKALRWVNMAHQATVEHFFGAEDRHDTTDAVPDTKTCF